MELISKAYDYETKAKNTLKIHIIYSIAQFVSHITKCFGLIYRTEFIDFFIFDSTQVATEKILTPYIDALSKFRDNIKVAAAVDKDTVKVLKICDEFRDDVLPYLGVKIEDKGKGVPSFWRIYEDKDAFIKEIERAKELANKKQKEKELQIKEKELKNSTNAKQWYALQVDKYSKFDEEGLPTHDNVGYEISKEAKNKLKKDFKKHEDNYKKYMEKISKGQKPDDAEEDVEK